MVDPAGRGRSPAPPANTRGSGAGNRRPSGREGAVFSNVLNTVESSAASTRSPQEAGGQTVGTDQEQSARKTGGGSGLRKLGAKSMENLNAMFRSRSRPPTGRLPPSAFELRGRDIYVVTARQPEGVKTRAGGRLEAVQMTMERLGWDRARTPSSIEAIKPGGDCQLYARTDEGVVREINLIPGGNLGNFIGYNQYSSNSPESVFGSGEVKLPEGTIDFSIGSDGKLVYLQEEDGESGKRTHAYAAKLPPKPDTLPEGRNRALEGERQATAEEIQAVNESSENMPRISAAFTHAGDRIHRLIDEVGNEWRPRAGSPSVWAVKLTAKPDPVGGPVDARRLPELMADNGDSSAGTRRLESVTLDSKGRIRGRDNLGDSWLFTANADEAGGGEWARAVSGLRKLTTRSTEGLRAMAGQLSGATTLVRGESEVPEVPELPSGLEGTSSARDEGARSRRRIGVADFDLLREATEDIRDMQIAGAGTAGQGDIPGAFRLRDGVLRHITPENPEGASALAQTQFDVVGINSYRWDQSRTPHRIVDIKSGGDGNLYALSDDGVVRRIEQTPGKFFGGFEGFNYKGDSPETCFGAGVAKLPNGTIDFSIGSEGQCVLLKAEGHGPGRHIRAFTAMLPPTPNSLKAERDRPLDKERRSHPSWIPGEHDMPWNRMESAYVHDDGWVRGFDYGGNEYSYVKNSASPESSMWTMIERAWTDPVGELCDVAPLPSLATNDGRHIVNSNRLQSVARDINGTVWGLDQFNKVWAFSTNADEPGSGVWKYHGPAEEGVAALTLRAGRLAGTDSEGQLIENPASDR